MEERTTEVPVLGPVVLAVGCGAGMLARCQSAAAAVGIDLVPVDLISLAMTAAAMRPLVVMISEDVYCFDPEELDALSLSVGAGRLVIHLDDTKATIQELLSVAVDEVRDARARSAKPPRRPTSGIRWTATSPHRKTA